MTGSCARFFKKRIGRSHQPEWRFWGTPSPSWVAILAVSAALTRCYGFRWLRCGLVQAVAQDLHLLQRDQTARHHGVESGQELVDLVLAVDDLDHQRQVFGQPQDLRRVQPARFAEAHRPAQHGGAGEVQFARFQYDRFIERLRAGLVVLADEDTEQQGLLWDLHGQLPFRRLRRFAVTWPSQTASNQPTTETMILISAAERFPACSRRNVSRLNDENVV